MIFSYWYHQVFPMFVYKFVEMNISITVFFFLTLELNVDKKTR